VARPADGGLGVVKRTIPIENIYYLFCYAWDRFPEGRTIGVGTVESPRICDLFASVLLGGVKRIKRRGLDRGYIETQDDISGVRGRIVLADTLRRDLLRVGRANCRFDDLSYDILNNQIIKATISRLLDVHELDATLCQELSRVKRLFIEVTDIALSNSSFRRVQLSRNNGNYDLLIKICSLVQSALLPHEDGKGSKFSNILENKALMWDVFQAFVLNFFKAEQREFSVKSEYIRWDAVALNVESAQYLPVMRTDVTLRSQTSPSYSAGLEFELTGVAQSVELA
jgi:5-methylcytosine-specific restriction enzyme subunit McrC